MLNELVSIVAIGFNVEKTISDCLNSLIHQTYSNIQIIFVDDGSTDSTMDIVKDIAVNNSQIKYVYQKNQGANAARKRGFSEAIGKYVLFIDGDDVLVSEAVSLLINNIYMHPLIDIVAYDYYTFNDKNDRLYVNHSFCIQEYKELEFLEDILNGNQPHVIWNKLYKKAFLERAHFLEVPSITMGDDMAANVRIALCRPLVSTIENKIYGYRVQNTGVSRKPNEKYMELLLMMQDVEEQLEKYGLRQKYTELVDFNWFLLFYYYVVKNKYRYNNIQKNIYYAWKAKKIVIQKNIYIIHYLKSKKLYLRILAVLIDRFEIVEILLTRLFAKKDRIE